MGSYLCYDIRGIQSFIFRIPKLKYVIGGSALIDRFDRETAPSLACDGVKHLYSGGGKGTYLCDKDTAKVLQEKLIAAAHGIGLDIRFGKNEDFAKSSRQAVELYPFVPDKLEGKPCPQSGLYPVGSGIDAHPVVRKRVFSEHEAMFRHFERRLDPKKSIRLPGIDPEKMVFFRNVSADSADSQDDGYWGAKALGGRNRWAVICMDGNDMGMQLRTMTEQRKPPEEEMIRWIKEMSQALDACSEEATKAGIQRVVSEWAATDDFDLDRANDQLVLPVRPIVVGGDDIVILCHVAHAMTFVKEAIRVFRTKSVELQKKAGIELWPATGGEISISVNCRICLRSWWRCSSLAFGWLSASRANTKRTWLATLAKCKCTARATLKSDTAAA